MNTHLGLPALAAGFNERNASFVLVGAARARSHCVPRLIDSGLDDALLAPQGSAEQANGFAPKQGKFRMLAQRFVGEMGCEIASGKRLRYEFN